MSAIDYVKNNIYTKLTIAKQIYRLLLDSESLNTGRQALFLFMNTECEMKESLLLSK